MLNVSFNSCAQPARTPGIQPGLEADMAMCRQGQGAGKMQVRTDEPTNRNIPREGPCKGAGGRGGGMSHTREVIVDHVPKHAHGLAVCAVLGQEHDVRGVCIHHTSA